MEDILYTTSAIESRIREMVNITGLSKYDYSKDYLTFEALEDGTFSITFTGTSSYGGYYITREMRESFSYSLDNGETWTTFETPSDTFTGVALTTPTIQAGQKVLWKGIGKRNYVAGPSSAQCLMLSTGNFNISGNILSIVYSDDFINYTELPDGASNTFGYLFDTSKVISAKNLILPSEGLVYGCFMSMFLSCNLLTEAPKLLALTLNNYCYLSMFSGCSSLEVAPELPATTLAPSCYSGMFMGCSSLTHVPELPATTLATSCYLGMFTSCISLTQAPKLKATELADLCYESMFKDCTSLTTAPELPAITLVNGCYLNMFSYCSSLNYIKAMFTTTPTQFYNGPTFNWVNLVPNEGTFVKNVNATWSLEGVSGIPTGWEVTLEAPNTSPTSPH